MKIILPLLLSFLVLPLRAHAEKPSDVFLEYHKGTQRGMSWTEAKKFHTDAQAKEVRQRAAAAGMSAADFYRKKADFEKTLANCMDPKLTSEEVVKDKAALEYSIVDLCGEGGKEKSPYRWRNMEKSGKSYIRIMV